MRGILGRAQLRVGMLGFGGSQIGNMFKEVNDDIAKATVDMAWEVGIRYFDTAPRYGLGLSERRLGRALLPQPRNSYALSTKVGWLLTPTGPVPDFSRSAVLRSLEQSLTRLGAEYVDIVYVHDPDDHMDQAIAEAIPTLLELRDQGVVRSVGAGMNHWQPLLRIATETAVDVVLVAGRWTLLDRSGLPLLDACAERQVSVVVAAPFNSGVLAQPWPSDGARFDYRPATAQELSAARSLATICSEQGAELPGAALQFPLRHPAVSCVLAGMRTPQEVRQCVGWQRKPVPAPVWDQLTGG